LNIVRVRVLTNQSESYMDKKRWNQYYKCVL
jgi:hypothetical protein